MNKIQTPPEVNFVTGLHHFILDWDSRRDATLKFDTSIIKVSDNGKINTSGERDNPSAYLLTSSHPAFEALLEPSIKNAVLCLIDKYNVITYSSCEGHVHADFFERAHIRMVARTIDEHHSLLGALRRIAETTNAMLPLSDMKVLCREAIIETDDGTDRTGVDLFFTSASNDANKYVSSREVFMEQFCREAVKYSESQTSQA